MINAQTEFEKEFPEGKLSEELSKYSTFKIGGPADFFFHLKKAADLPALIRFSKIHSLPYLIIGGGSNILFDDEGFRGLVIRIENKSIEINDLEVTADAGVFIPKLIQASIEGGLTGLENWAGLPGTVGGAVRGNAGCHGLETKDVLKSALIFDPKTEKTEEYPREWFEFDYRSSKLKSSGEIVLQATFKLEKMGEKTEEKEKIMKDSQNFRLTKQPFGFTTGSFFKNPSPDKPAGMLIDQVGLKGKTIGNAQISEKHGNFFLNLGGASSKDVLELAELAKKEVKAKFGIELKEEVQIISKQS